ncbi:hypothetical protein TESG_07291 [Trichophyton tonsurans CBS 112818]|uniref:Uncharacterized protein n=1 Tax=Trichophyton tonsurans (strain CBS 112818) TaxID=647933 RepID=F2S8R4_TRIT1|nr:hypothetical protein TESG_07291 [Trichophyton tonsurans CBS 112818]
MDRDPRTHQAQGKQTRGQSTPRTMLAIGHATKVLCRPETTTKGLYNIPPFQQMLHTLALAYFPIRTRATSEDGSTSEQRTGGPTGATPELQQKADQLQGREWGSHQELRES